MLSMHFCKKNSHSQLMMRDLSNPFTDLLFVG